LKTHRVKAQKEKHYYFWNFCSYKRIYISP